MPHCRGSDVLRFLRVAALLLIVDRTLGLKGVAAMSALVIFWGDHWDAGIWLDAAGYLALVALAVALLFGAGIGPGDVIPVVAGGASTAILAMRARGADPLEELTGVSLQKEGWVFSTAKWLTLGAAVVIIGIPLIKLALEAVLAIALVVFIVLFGLLFWLLISFGAS